MKVDVCVLYIPLNKWIVSSNLAYVTKQNPVPSFLFLLFEVGMCVMELA